MVYFYIAVAFVLGLGAKILVGHLGKYTAITMYEVPNDMVPIEREVLEDIIADSESHDVPSPEYPRQRVRLDLESIQVRLLRMLSNAKRPKYWALFDQRVNEKNKLEHPPEVSAGIKRVLEAERELRWPTVRLLIQIWLWNMSGFHLREWGPIPDVRRFRIPEILQAYDKLELAAVELARSYGEAAVAEEIAAAM